MRINLRYSYIDLKHTHFKCFKHFFLFLDDLEQLNKIILQVSSPPLVLLVADPDCRVMGEGEGRGGGGGRGGDGEGGG